MRCAGGKNSLKGGLFLLALACLLGAGTVMAAEFTMKLGHATANDAQDEIAKLFAREVERLSKGRIQATVYNASTLGNNQKMNMDVRSGAQEALEQPAGFAVPYVPILGVLDLPFLFTNLGVQTKVLMNKTAIDPFLQAQRKVGLEMVSIYSGGFKYFATKFPLRTADDMKGRKLRVIQSPELVAQIKAFGAIGVPLPLGEVYTAIQQGVVEGVEAPIDVIEHMRFHEVAKYIASIQHGTLSTFIVVNKRWLDGMPKELQEAVRQAGRTTDAEALKIYSKFQQNSLDVMKKGGAVYTEFPEAEKAKLKAAGEKVWEESRKDKAKAETLQPLLKAIQEAK